ncbi:MAG: hypothetical protein H6Q89_4114 [Myxococcaceae bacterium]|nr:hypothetical protein [Myxococcaceae bacterium]
MVKDAASGPSIAIRISCRSTSPMLVIATSGSVVTSTGNSRRNGSGAKSIEGGVTPTVPTHFRAAEQSGVTAICAWAPSPSSTTSMVGCSGSSLAIDSVAA